MIQRVFFPGDKWVYFKVYTSPINANDVLIRRILPIISKWTDMNLITKWFFIRYADPNHHLRIRVELHDIRSVGAIIHEMRIQLNEELDEGIISNLQIDTYQREIERYGEENIIKCESFFCEDSNEVLELIKIKSKELDIITQTIDWINNLFLVLKMSQKDMMDFSSNMKQRYLQEFKFSNEQISVINKTFRNISNKVVDILFKRLKPSQHEIENKSWIRNQINFDKLLASLIHMHINRVFNSNQRLYEYIIYHMFCKGLDSILKRYD